MARPASKPKPTPADIDVKDIPANRPEDPTITQAIETARERLERKADVLKEVQNSRQLLTLLIESNLGSREQVQWVRFFLPRKTRKEGKAEEGTESGAES